MVNGAFIFCTANILGCFCNVMAQFELVTVVDNITFLCSFHTRLGIKKGTTCQRTNYCETTNHGAYLLQLELLRSYDIHTVILQELLIHPRVIIFKKARERKSIDAFSKNTPWNCKQIYWCLEQPLWGASWGSVPMGKKMLRFNR